MRIIIENADNDDFNELAKLAREGKIHTFCMTDEEEWIPVSERLPEIEDDVIVTDIETSNTYQAYYIGNGFWDCDNGVFNNRVIAWQPLPEPYKGPHDHSDEPIRCKAENCSPEGCKHCSGYGPIESGGAEDAKQ